MPKAKVPPPAKKPRCANCRRQLALIGKAGAVLFECPDDGLVIMLPPGYRGITAEKCPRCSWGPRLLLRADGIVRRCYSCGRRFAKSGALVARGALVEV